MAYTQGKKAKLNISITLLCQLISIVCGVIIPKLLIDAFGSEAYGATSSITQFLAYITLLEGGVASVARAALYKPLAENDMERVSSVMVEIRRFFSVIAYIFIGYVLILACSFKFISGLQYLDWISTFLLVVVISFSTFAQYFIGISYSVLLHAAQKNYVINAISVCAQILNAGLVLGCVWLEFDLIIVKFVSSLVFALKPVMLYLYVRKRYALVKAKTRNPDVLKQKWEGLGQHIAFFLHYNTDIAILTVCSDLIKVAIYSIYNMIIHHIQTLAFSFSAGMEAVFGELLAKGEDQKLHKWFGYYETLISVIVIILYTTTATLIVPFVQLYTANVQDADYVQPLFAIIMALSSALYCLRLPYHSMTIAAGHFRQTRTAAYGEAIINIVLSLILVYKYELVGVAFATMIATLFRFVYYVVYLSKNICNRKIILFLKRIIVNIVSFAIVFAINNSIFMFITIKNYFIWGACGVIAVIVSASVALLANWLFYREYINTMLQGFFKKIQRAKQ